jgi:diacylglycerol kinase (ATP)
VRINLKKYILLYNPLSGKASFKNKLDTVINKFQKRDALIIPYRTSSKNDTRKFISAINEQNDLDGIIVSGGDGTIHEVINSLIKENVDLPIGLIPNGTSNDFATYLNIDQNISRCADMITNGKVRNVDIGKANDKYFINVASAGLMTSVAHSVDTVFKNTLGKMAYYIKGIGELPNLKPIRMKINADGNIIEDDIFLFLVMNSRTVGSFPNLAPDAKIDDGKLDMLIVSKCNMPEVMTLFIGLIKGDHTNHKNIRYFQAKDISIECDEKLESDLDGELGPNLPLNISTITNKIKFFCE